MCSNNWKEEQQHRFKNNGKNKRRKVLNDGSLRHLTEHKYSSFLPYINYSENRARFGSCPPLSRALLLLVPHIKYRFNSLSLLCIDICVCLFHIICMSKGEGRQPRREALLSSLLYMSWKKIQRSMKEAPTASPKDMPEKGGVVHSERENSAWRKCPRDASKSSWPPHRSWCTSQKKKKRYKQKPLFSLSLSGWHTRFDLSFSTSV